jgi:hypothetical protein
MLSPLHERNQTHTLPDLDSEAKCLWCALKICSVTQDWENDIIAQLVLKTKCLQFLGQCGTITSEEVFL